MLFSGRSNRMYGSRVSRRQFFGKLSAKAGNKYPTDAGWSVEKELTSIAQCIRMVAIELDISKTDCAPLTPPNQVLAAAGSSCVLSEEVPVAETDGLQHGIVADQEINVCHDLLAS